jgi:PKD repeat protein
MIINAGVTGYNWSIPGATPSTSTAQNPIITFPSKGYYDITLIVKNAQGSDTVQKNGAIYAFDNQGTYSAPFSEGFESSVFPPWNWSVDGTGSENWKSVVGSSVSGNQAAIIDNDNGRSGDEFELISPSFDISSITNPKLQFYYSFAQNPRVIQGNLVGTSDELAVYCSNDCGETWVKRWTASGDKLSHFCRNSANVSFLLFA